MPTGQTDQHMCLFAMQSHQSSALDTTDDLVGLDCLDLAAGNAAGKVASKSADLLLTIRKYLT